MMEMHGPHDSLHKRQSIQKTTSFSNRPHHDDSESSSVATSPLSRDDTIMGPAEYEASGSNAARKRALLFSDVGLYGRSQETKVLRGAFIKAKTSRQLVLLKGPAGIGKTSLVLQLKQTVENYPGIYGSGNYSLNQFEEPYAAIAQACNQLCLELAGNEKIKKMLRKEFKAESESFLRIVPGVESLMGITATIAEAEEVAADGTRLDERNQLLAAFRQFFQILGSTGKSIVLAIDNLHCADQSSLELIRHILSDRENPTLMLVGCYRDNEVVGDTHPLSVMTKKLEGVESLEITTIAIGNLSVSAIGSMLVDLCYTGNDRGPDTRPLAEVIHAKTLGNPFHSLQFVASLSDEKLLAYSEVKAKWTWNLEKIKSSTAATANVIELLQHNLQRLPGRHTSKLMQLAACLGTTIHLEIFELVVDDFYKHLTDGTYFESEDEESFADQDSDEERQLGAHETLRIVEEEGLIESVDDTDSYRWVHDKLEESAYLLLKRNRRCHIQLSLGCLIMSRLNPGRMYKHLYSVVRLLNAGSSAIPSADTCTRTAIIDLNRQAGRRSIEASSFASAQEYFLKAIQLLSPNKWVESPALTLDLYSSAAEAEYCIGSMEEMKIHCNEVISLDNVPLLWKQRAYTTLMAGLNGQGKPEEALELCIAVLAKLDCRIPKRMVLLRVIPEFLRAKLWVDEITAVELDDLKIMTDPKRRWIMACLDKMFNFAYLANKPEYNAAAIAKSFQYTMRYGASEDTPAAMARMGVAMTSSLREPGIGRAYADYAMRLLKIFDSKHVVCRTHFLVHSFVYHWTANLVVEPLLSAYKVGMAVGDAEDACWNLYFVLQHSFHLGVSLAAFVQSATRYSHQMEELGQEIPLAFTVCIQHTARNLMDSDEAKALEYHCDKTMNTVAVTHEADATQVIRGMRMWQMYLAFVYNDFEHHFHMRNFLDEATLERAFPGVICVPILNFCSGLVAFSLFRKTKKRSYKKIGCAIRRRMRRWMKDGNPNIINQVALLDAEWCEIGQNYGEAISKFETSINVARKRDVVHEEAIAEQRFGEFYLRLGDQASGSTHIAKSSNLFEDWGAHGKVKQLMKQYPECFHYSDL